MANLAYTLPSQLALTIALNIGITSPLLASDPIPDPFAPPTNLTAAKPEQEGSRMAEAALSLQATHVSQTTSHAVINGQRMRPGDLIGNAKLVSVGPASVTLSNADGEFVLRFSGHGLVKRPAGQRE